MMYKNMVIEESTKQQPMNMKLHIVLENDLPYGTKLTISNAVTEYYSLPFFVIIQTQADVRDKYCLEILWAKNDDCKFVWKSWLDVDMAWSYEFSIKIYGIASIREAIRKANEYIDIRLLALRQMIPMLHNGQLPVKSPFEHIEILMHPSYYGNKMNLDPEEFGVKNR